MTDQEDADDVEEGRVEEPRSEGVRIIGAQEAAEAVGRPDVARRRRRGEKRFGDRPDQPEPAANLPKVRISTSEPDPTDGTPSDPGDHFGAVPVVRAPAQEPRLANDDFVATPDPDAGRTYGHARAVPAEDASAWAPAEEPPGWEPAEEPSGWEPAEEPSAWEPAAADEPLPAAGSDFDQPGGDSPGDDSFVLPHWTEPPTGQVPKVVIGDDPAESDPASYGSQPRWRDEGERSVATDFDDLLDDGPRLGALGEDPLPDPDVDADFFDPEPERHPFDDERPATRRGGVRRDRSQPSEPPEPDDGDRSGSDGGSGGRPPGGGDRNLVIAIAVGVVLVALGLVSFALGGLATTVLASVIVGMAAYEFFGAVEARGFQPAGLLGLVATVGLLAATYFSGLNAYPVVLTLTVVLGLLWYLWVTPGEHSVRNLGITLLGVMWIGFLGSFATLFLGLGKVIQDANPRASSNIGIGVLIAAVIAAVSHDVGAYFVGRYAGRTPMSAASPNKTLEGLVGGVVVSIVVTVAVVGVIGIAPIGGDIVRVFVFALLCAVVAPLGDLCESFIKRDLDIKDMGSVLPGHGGVLDRFDALLFVLPAAYFVTVLFDIWA